MRLVVINSITLDGVMQAPGRLDEDTRNGFAHGGWASAAMVDEVYGHVDVHDPAFDAALRTVWGEGR